jgi:predicted Zn-dependent protease
MQAQDVAFLGFQRIALFVCLSLASVTAALAQSTRIRNSAFEDIGNRSLNRHDLNVFSIAEELRLGQRQAASMVRDEDWRFVSNKVADHYLQDIADSLSANSDSQFPIRVRIVDIDKLDIVSFPGGIIYISRGLLMQTNTEAELAGLLAHEIGHIAARHETERTSRERMLTMAMSPLRVFGAGRIAYLGSILFNWIRSSQKNEDEADFLAVQYSYKSGRDPAGLIDFLEKIQAQQSASEMDLPRFLRNGRSPADRIVKIERAIQSLPQKDEQALALTTSRFDSMHITLLNENHTQPPRPLKLGR